MNNGRKRLWVILAAWLAYGLHAVVVIWAAVESVWPIPLPAVALMVLGIVLMVLGAFLYVSSIVAFDSLAWASGRRTKLVTGGIYCHCRHPQYLGWLMFILGISLAGGSLFALLLSLCLVPALALIILIEERQLTEIFGEAYRDYRMRTPILPFVRYG